MRLFWNWSFLVLTVLNLMDKPEICIAAENGKQLRVTSASQFFRDNCYCESNWTCQCCLKYDNNFLNVHQNLCGSWTMHLKQFTIDIKLALNDMVLFKNTFSADKIPPMCFPIVPPLPIAACVKIHSLRQHDNNQIHACTNGTLNLMGFDMMNLGFGCIDFGLLGIELVEPNHDPDAEGEPEISLETSDTMKNSQRP